MAEKLRRDGESWGRHTMRRDIGLTLGKNKNNDSETSGNLVVLCDLVGGQNDPKWTMLSCQTLEQSEASI